MTIEQTSMWDLPPVAPPEPEPSPDQEEEAEWSSPPATVEEALTEFGDVAEPEPPAEEIAATGCPRCGRVRGHEQTCPNLQQAARFVDVNILLERQAAEAEAGEEAPVAGQITAFGDDDDFRLQWQEWRGMPEYVSRDLAPFKSVLVHFETEDHYRQFAELVGQKWLTRKTRSIWYPEAEWARERGVARYADVTAEHDAESEGLQT